MFVEFQKPVVKVPHKVPIKHQKVRDNQGNCPGLASTVVEKMVENRNTWAIRRPLKCSKWVFNTKVTIVNSISSIDWVSQHMV